MNISSAFLGMQTGQNMNAISTALLSKSLDNAKDMGSQMASMIASAPSPSLESLANPAVGKNIDLTV